MESTKQLDIPIITYAKQSQLPLISEKLNEADLIIDALIGYGLVQNPKGLTKELINCINQSETDVLSLDIPSGINGETGKQAKPCIHAQKTLTLALPKKGFLYNDAKLFIGEVYLADISVPPTLYKQLNIDMPSCFNGRSYIPLKLN